MRQLELAAVVGYSGVISNKNTVIIGWREIPFTQVSNANNGSPRVYHVPRADLISEGAVIFIKFLNIEKHGSTRTDLNDFNRVGCQHPVLEDLHGFLEDLVVEQTPRAVLVARQIQLTSPCTSRLCAECLLRAHHQPRPPAYPPRWGRCAPAQQHCARTAAQVRQRVSSRTCTVALSSRANAPTPLDRQGLAARRWCLPLSLSGRRPAPRSALLQCFGKHRMRRIFNGRDARYATERGRERERDSGSPRAQLTSPRPSMTHI